MTVGKADPTHRRMPIYSLIADMLRKAIRDGSIEHGTVLLEGPIADILGSTRAPVRQALKELESAGLVCRFDGRGVLAGPTGTTPKRIPLDAAILGVSTTGEAVRKSQGWESIYDEVERDVVNVSFFGGYHISEVQLARNFNVGRAVAHDVLIRLERLGLIEKDIRSRWMVRPLDEARIRNLYELRWLLEPAALASAMASSPASKISAMMAELRSAMKAYPSISRTELDSLEHNFHVSFLSGCTNMELLKSLERTRCLLTLSKHVLGVSAPMPKKDPFMAEHLSVLRAVSKGEIERAQGLMRKHLESSCIKVSNRVSDLRNNLQAPDLAYIS